MALEPDTFLRDYTSQETTLKYTRATSGFGISYLLDHDYQTLYLKALDLLLLEVRQRGIRLLEFGCGGGMNLLHLVAVLNREGLKVSQAIGTDFSPALIDAAIARNAVTRASQKAGLSTCGERQPARPQLVKSHHGTAGTISYRSWRIVAGQ